MITTKERDLCLVAIVADMAIKEYVEDLQDVILDTKMKRYVNCMKTYFQKIESRYKKEVKISGGEHTRIYRLLKESKSKIKVTGESIYISFCKQDIIFLNAIESALSYMNESKEKMKTLDNEVKENIKKCLGYYNAFIRHVIKIGE